MYNVIGRQDPPVITHPGFYYGFVGTAIAWQIGFLMIGRNPVTLRPVMIAAAVEKFTYSVAVIVLVAQSRMHPSDLPFGVQDLLLGILFINPGYLDPMFHHLGGIIAMMVGVVMIVIGSVVIGRIVDIDV